MTQENKELLLKDLCTRLPYNVRVKYNGTTRTNMFDVLGIAHGRIILCLPFMSTTECPFIEKVKPYLFPLESMTEEQRREYDKIIYHSIELHHREYSDIVEIDLFDNLQDFYCKNHFDYRGLIPKGLALDATGLNIY